MGILRGVKLSRLMLVIAVSLVSLTTFPLKGYCGDDWVYVNKFKNFTLYYNSSSFKVDSQNHIIKVWEKRVYTNEGKDDFFNKFNNINKQKYNELNHTLVLMVLNYKDWKYSVTHITHYSISGNVLFDAEGPIEWVDIKPDSIGDKVFNKILKDHDIRR